MHTLRTFIARFFAVLFSLAFILMAILSSLLVNIDRRLMSAETYKSILANQKIYERLPRIIAEQMVLSMDYNPCNSNPLMCEGASVQFQDCARQVLGEERFPVLSTDKERPTDEELQLLQDCIDQFGSNLQPALNASSGPPPLLKSLSVADWEAIISNLLPADDLKTMTEQTLDQIVAYLSGKQSTASISLVNMKARVSGLAGADAILKIMRAQQPCTADQTAQMQVILEGAAGEMMFCLPSEDKLLSMLPFFTSQLVNYVTSIPDEIILLNSESGENSDGPLGNLGGQIRLLRFLLRISPVLPLLFLLIMTLFAVRSVKSWLRCWGIPFFITSALALGISITTASTFEQIWITHLANRMPPNFSLGLVTLAHDLLRNLTQSLLAGIRLDAFWLGLLGLLMWVGSYFIRPKPEPEPKPKPAA